MENKFYIALTLEHESCTHLLTQYKQIRENLTYFFGLPEYKESIEIPHITIIPPFTAEVVDARNIELILKEEKSLLKNIALWQAGYIEFDHNGKSFGMRLNGGSKTERLIEKIYSILKPMHIDVIKTYEQVLETMHLTLIKEITDSIQFERGKRYIEMHYPTPYLSMQKPLIGRLKIFAKDTDQQWKEWLVLTPQGSLSQ